LKPECTNLDRPRIPELEFAVGAACEEAHGDRLSALGQVDRLCREIGICEQLIDRLSERAHLFAGLSRSGGGIDDLKVMGDCGRLGDHCRCRQYFSTDSTMARPTFSGATGLGVGAP
jgi:hypothetical protein